MELWGITGLVGSGKSYALKLLKAKGCPVIDSDEVSRWAVDASRPHNVTILSVIRNHFGSEIFSATELNRKKLRERIMISVQDRIFLEKLLHPRILELIQEWALDQTKKGAKIAFVEGTKLVESGYHRHLQGMIVVVSDEESRKQRLKSREGLSAEDVKKILLSQDAELMLKHAQVVWKNEEAGESSLNSQLDAFLKGRGFL